jgi:organic hydroperoxide reductase OsmC/OhrA
MESGQPKVKHKSFSYITGLEWKGGKTGCLSSEGRPHIQVSSPPEFKGDAGNWTPEDLFVGTVEMCQMLTFLALAQKHQLPVVSYRSTARGTLEFVDGAYRFTHVVVTPTVVIEELATEAEALNLLNEAHKRCLIANSITASVEVNATVLHQESEVNMGAAGHNA